MPPASIVHRFCTMLHAILSSQLHVIFMPPVHFSTLKVQRGTMSQLLLTGIVGVGEVIPGMPMPGVPMPGIPMRSIIIALDIGITPFPGLAFPSLPHSLSTRGQRPASLGLLLNTKGAERM